MRPIGILGGTFDPVHFGHLRPALECLERLRLAELRLVPAGRPPHRAAPVASGEARLTMLRLATEGEPRLVVDDRELHRTGPSYTVDTLQELRDEFGPDRALVLFLGLDAALGLPGWHCPERIRELASIVVVHRPGPEPLVEGSMADLIRGSAEATPEAIARQPAGGIWHLAVTQLDISATQVRALCREGKSARYLLPEPVRTHINEHRIYR